MNRTDLADPTTGILATLEQNHPLAVFERGTNGGSASFELARRPVGPVLEIAGGDLLGNWSAQTQILSGLLRGGDGSTTPIEAIGAVVTGSRNGTAEAAGAAAGGESGAAGEATARDRARLRRCIAICREDFGLLIVVTAGDEGCRDHGSEVAAAVLAEPDGELVRYDEVLLSTEYGADGQQRRATLELRRDLDGGREQEILRGAGVAVAATELVLPGARSRLAFFEWSIAGEPAIGRYEIIKAV